jgi:hypothetical protein
VRAESRPQPETLEQAMHWQKMKGAYLLRGLCHKCAAQAAYGHQRGAGGWKVLHPPCPDCAGIVEMFAYATPNPFWRSMSRKRI